MTNIDPNPELQVIPKENLKNLHFYKGFCRNAYIAQWMEREQIFYHFQNEWSNAPGIRTLKHISDCDTRTDGFVPVEEIIQIDYNTQQRITKEIGY